MRPLSDAAFPATSPGKRICKSMDYYYYISAGEKIPPFIFEERVAQIARPSVYFVKVTTFVLLIR